MSYSEQASKDESSRLMTRALEAQQRAAKAEEKVRFALEWADGIPRLADSPKRYVLSSEDIEAFKSALRS